MVRKIKIYTTAGMPGTIETNAITLAELKPLLTQREINFIGMKMLVGETKNELSMDDSVLPEGDFKLYLMPAKTKSGINFEDLATSVDNTEENVEDISIKINGIENTVNRILSLLQAKSSSTGTGYIPVTSAPTMSSEDAAALAELKALASGSSNEWD